MKLKKENKKEKVIHNKKEGFSYFAVAFEMMA
jgi:hypothetical protein